jgi:hypothetical protein
MGGPPKAFAHFRNHHGFPASLKVVYTKVLIEVHVKSRFFWFFMEKSAFFARDALDSGSLDK